MKLSDRMPLKHFTQKPNYRWFILGTILMGAFMSALDINLMNILNPTLHEVFHQPLNVVAWATIAYLLTLTVLLPIFGKISDIFGRKKMYNTGFVIFIIGSAMCGLSFDMPWLIGWRVVQAFGATMLQANSIAIITANFSHEERGRAIGIQGAIQAIGMAVGPSLGGFFINFLTWRYAFFINVPVGIAGTIAAYLILPKSEIIVEKRKIDYVGSSLFTLFLGLILIVLTNNNLFFGLNFAIILLVIAFLCGFVFVKYELSKDSPLIDFSLFKNRLFVAGNFSGLISYLSLNGVLLISPFFMIYALNYKDYFAGLLLMIIPFFMAITAPVSGYLYDRSQSTLIHFFGLVIMAIGLIFLYFISLNTSVPYLIISFIVLGTGMGIFTPPNNSSVMSVAPSGKLSAVGGFLNMMRSLGNVFGVAVSSIIYVTYTKLYDINNPTNLSVVMTFKIVMLVLLLITIVGIILTLIKGDTQKRRIFGFSIGK